MEKGFHYKDGLYFRRNEDHSVTIKQMKRNHVDETEASFEVTIDENGWASIIASVSKDGEGDGRFYKALEWHNGSAVSDAKVDLFTNDSMLGLGYSNEQREKM